MVCYGLARPGGLSVALSRRLLVTITIAVLALPPATAVWSGMGNREPSTLHDLEGWMFLNPDTSNGANQVYFNGFIFVSQQGATAGSAPSPNVARSSPASIR